MGFHVDDERAAIIAGPLHGDKCEEEKKGDQGEPKAFHGFVA
jgi:hypothetical protein